MLEIKNTKALTDSKNFRLKILAYAVPDFGKTTFVSTAPNPGIAACETGEGNGLLSLADVNRSFDYVEVRDYPSLEAYCSGAVFKDKDTLALDSVTDMVRSIIKDYVLSEVNRKTGDSDKRRMGVPEQDDYGSMGEVTRRLLRKLIAQSKHVIVTALLSCYQPPVIDQFNPKNNRAERMGGPDLPGQLLLASAAMFDVVLRGTYRPILLDPKDPKSRIMKRYWITEADSHYVAKSRLTKDYHSVLPREIEYDLKANTGTFEHILKLYLDAHNKEVIH